MGSNNIIPLVPDLRTTSSISFNKTDKSKFLLTKETTVTDNRLGKIVSCESEELGAYEITTSNDFDESIKYEDGCGNTIEMKFKKVDEESES